MYIIKYKNRITTYSNSEPQTEPIYELQDLEYPIFTLEEKNKWLDIIQKSYGMWGSVTVEENNLTKPLTDEEKILKLEVENKNLTDLILEMSMEVWK